MRRRKRFQFYKVRLEHFNKCRWNECSKFQFYKVRLEHNLGTIITYCVSKFQFYKVRLEQIASYFIFNYFNNFNSIK